MDKYDGLLLKVAQQYNIPKGTTEAEADWKARIIYSISGMMAYTSLWDDSEEPVSLVHLKRKIKSIFKSYQLMYPELSTYLPDSSEELEEEIADQFLKTGIVYHRPNRIMPATKHEEQLGNVIFQRGIALDDISCVSGIGFYSLHNEKLCTDRLKLMFGLERKNLQELWETALHTASWTSDLTIDSNTEYLRLKPPFSYGYWIDKPDTSGNISILRTGMKGAQLYYLYRYKSNGIELSPLPQWQVELYNYRALACACLSHYGTLPPMDYYEDGALVHIRMNYLLPPRELEFLKLYSWPETYKTLPCDFRRKLSTQIFTEIKCLLTNEGYKFNGGTF